MEFQAELYYGDKKTPYGFDDTAKNEVTGILEATLKEQVSAAIERAQKEFKCDYLQFDDIFRIRYPSEYENMDWQKEFPQASATVDVKVDLRTTWSMDYETSE